jgi:hypothetical protein
MALATAQSKNKILAKTLAYGAATAALYAAVFMNSGLVMKYFTKGGWYAAMPVATVFVFSYFHGVFAGSLWSLLGIEPRKREAVQKRVTTPAYERKRPRPRVSLSVK